MSVPTRPVLRWHGGKWKLAPWIISNLPPHRIYVEPYGGAASVLLRKPRSYAEVYNDLDGDVVNLFQVLRDDTQALELQRQLRLTPFARDEFVESSELTDSSLERARRLCIRSFMGFGSNAHNVRRKTGFRSNSNRSGTTPAHDWANYPERLTAIIERLSGVCIENRDACDLMRQHDSAETLHYVDPPYVAATRSIKNVYDLKYAGGMYAHEMSDADHVAMADCLRSLKGMVVLSGYQSALYSSLFPAWPTVCVAALADGARDRIETLWFNRRAWDRRQNPDMLSTPILEAAE